MKTRITRRKSLLHLASVGVGVASLSQWSAAVEPAATPASPSAPRHRPRIVAFDVIETLFDTRPLDPLLSSIGLPEGSLAVWFPRFLRDAFALEVAGEYQPFREIASASLEALLREHRLDPVRANIDKVLSAFAELPAHPDVKPAFEALREGGVRIITLTNGSADTTRKMLAGAKVDAFVEQSLSIEQVKHWKPARVVYLHAAKVMGVEPHEVALVAAHDWDTAGAGRAGLTTGGVARDGKHFSSAMPPPDTLGATLVEVVRALLALPG